MKYFIAFAFSLFVSAAQAQFITPNVGTGGGGGSGTVTSVSVVSANGVSGTVANSTTTPAVTLTLGAITPSTVAVGGATIGTNALAAIGNASITGALTIASTVIGSVSDINYYDGTYRHLAIGGSFMGTGLAADYGTYWSSTPSFDPGDIYFNRDTSISRASAGVAQIGTGTYNALGSLALANLTASGTVRTGGYTVSTLPTVGTVGRRAYVTDATACTFLSALTGGGSTFCPVVDNGTAWVGG